MVAYVLQEHLINEVDMDEYNRICDIAKQTLSWEWAEPTLVSCHSLARVCRAASPNWKIGDGYFGRKGSNHSWLWKRNGLTTLIIDVYPIGGFEPLMIDAQNTPWNMLYVDDPRAYTKEEREEWAIHATKIYQKLFRSSGEIKDVT